MTLLLGSLVLVVLPIAAAGATREVEDPIGDSGLSPTGGLSPDLRAASVTIAPRGGLMLRARFARGTYDRATTFVQFSLHMGASSAEGNSCAQCGNFLVDINGIGARSDHAEVKRLTGDSNYELAGTVRIRTVADGFAVAVPRSLLAGDLSNVTYRVITCVKLDAKATSIILDALPDEGMASAVLESR